MPSHTPSNTSKESPSNQIKEDRNGSGPSSPSLVTASHQVPIIRRNRGTKVCVKVPSSLEVGQTVYLISSLDGSSAIPPHAYVLLINLTCSTQDLTPQLRFKHTRKGFRKLTAKDGELVFDMIVESHRGFKSGAINLYLYQRGSSAQLEWTQKAHCLLKVELRSEKGPKQTLICHLLPSNNIRTSLPDPTKALAHQQNPNPNPNHNSAPVQQPLIPGESDLVRVASLADSMEKVPDFKISEASQSQNPKVEQTNNEIGNSSDLFHRIPTRELLGNSQSIARTATDELFANMNQMFSTPSSNQLFLGQSFSRIPTLNVEGTGTSSANLADLRSSRGLSLSSASLERVIQEEREKETVK